MSLEIFAQRKPQHEIAGPPPVFKSKQDRRPSNFERQLSQPPRDKTERHSPREQKSEMPRHNIERRATTAPQREIHRTRPKEFEDKSDNLEVSSQEGPIIVPQHLIPGLTMDPTTNNQQIETNSSEVLETINRVYQNPETLRRDAPILSILTGRVEELSPLDIPKTILNSGIIQDAMSHEDIQNFMETPVDITEFMSDLGLDAIAAKMNSMNIEDKLVTPAEVFDSLGLDSQSVLSELKLLSGYLATDGLNPYMVRSAAIRGHRPQENETIKPAGFVSPLQQPSGQKTLTNQPITQMNVSEGPHNPQVKGQPQPSLDFPLGPWESHSADNIDTVHAMTGIPSSDTQEPWNELALARAMKNAQAALETKSTTHNSIPNLETVTDEGFADLGKTWETGTSVKTEFATENKPQNLNMVEEINRLSLQTNMNSSADIRDNAIEENTMKEGVQVDSLDTENTLSSEKDRLFSTTSSSSTSSDSGQRQEERSSSDSLPLDELLGTSIPQSKLSSSTTPFDLEIQNVEKIQESKQVRDIVFEKAQMMVKEGGGTIRLDLGTQDLGKIDLAIDVQNDALRLKITADSDKAREMLSQELPALRQALMDQSLDLKTVEIGLRQEEQWSQSNQEQADGQRQQSQEQMEDEESPLLKPSVSWADAKKSVSRSLATQISRPHSGNLQIRV